MTFSGVRSQGHCQPAARPGPAEPRGSPFQRL